MSAENKDPSTGVRGRAQKPGIAELFVHRCARLFAPNQCERLPKCYPFALYFEDDNGTARHTTAHPEAPTRQDRAADSRCERALHQNETWRERRDHAHLAISP